MNKRRLGSLLVLIGALAMAVAVALPWYNNAIQTVSGYETSGDFMVTAGFAVVLGALGFWMYKNPAPRGRAITALVVSLVAAGWAALLFSVVKTVADAALIPYSLGIGLYIIVAGAALAVIGSIAGLVSPRSAPTVKGLPVPV